MQRADSLEKTLNYPPTNKNNWKKKKDRKDPEAGRDQRHKEKEVAEDEMVRQHL